MLKTPDITPAQLIAIVGSVLGLVVAAGLPLSDALQAQIVDLVQILAPILLGADAAIRAGRAVGTGIRDRG